MKELRNGMTVCLLVLTQMSEMLAEDASVDQKPLVEFPFEEGAGNKLFVKVRVNNNRGPWWFVVDTGAPTTHLDFGCAKSLGLNLKNERQINVGAGSGQKIRAAKTDDVTFNIHGQEYIRKSVSILELHHVAEFMGRSVDGLIGNDFIKRYAFEIDYQPGTIRLYNAETYKHSAKAHVIPVNLSTERPEVRALVSIDGRQFDCDHLIVDTGANAALSISRHIVEKHGLLKGRQDIVSGIVSRGVGGSTKGAIDRINFIQLEKLCVREPVAMLSQDTSGFFTYKRFNGIVGGELLRRSKVTFDHSRKQMILEPYKNATRIHWDKSGLLIRAKHPDFDEFEVVSVIKGTPAAKAGVAVGDWVTQINGQATKTMPLVAITRLLKQIDGTRVRLGLRRGKQSLNVELVLKDFA